ncbi:alpha/beta hydrolase [Novosphingobium aquae]|uniref:Alpha/beta hydrolase fold domain-containing protein n=1 Tax=Novosphingobium aquae TaxID=3133435 RepID=A0ABU8SB96_9SPHN
MIDPFQFSGCVSDAARSAFAAAALDPAAPTDLADLRLHYDAYNRRLLAAALNRYSVGIEEIAIDGVKVHSVEPSLGVTDPRTLVCLHGGAFMWGSGAGALLEAVPLAVVTGMRVLAIDYRLAPEHTFPAAVDDVVTVYRDLLSRSAAHSIGFYGCSAGGMLTAQAVARIGHDQLPGPGAIAMLHGTALEFTGDTAATAAAFDPHATPGAYPTVDQLPYFVTADLQDPLVLPGNHPQALEKFPPSLLISGTRDFAASACATMHRRLLAAGVEADFVLFDGLWHAHHMDVELPESQEVFELVAKHFRQHLR